MNSEDWTKSYDQMSGMDPATPFSIGLLMAKAKLINAISAGVAVLVFGLLAVAIPLVVLLWRAAF